MTERRVTRGQLAVFVGAVICVPAIMLGVLVNDAIAVSDNQLHEILLLAALGAILGVALVEARHLRTPQPDAQPRYGTLGTILIVAAAVIGTFIDLPRTVDAFISGLAVGLFLALDVHLVRRWRSDPDFRERIRTILKPHGS